MVAETQYKLRDNDQCLALRPYACLASIAADDDEPLEIALDQVSAIRRTSNVVALIATGAILGDTTLFRVAYQINLILMRPH